MKKFLVLLLVSFLAVSCSNETPFKVSERGDDREIIPVSFDDFKSNPEKYRGKYVKLVGMCVRVDKRGGSTMYMIGKDPSFEIKVASGEDVVRFTRYFEGRALEVHGYVRAEDPAYALTRGKEAAHEDEDIRAYANPDYYIESDRYRRIQK